MVVHHGVGGQPGKQCAGVRAAPGIAVELGQAFVAFLHIEQVGGGIGVNLVAQQHQGLHGPCGVVDVFLHVQGQTVDGVALEGQARPAARAGQPADGGLCGAGGIEQQMAAVPAVPPGQAGQVQGHGCLWPAPHQFQRRQPCKGPLRGFAQPQHPVGARTFEQGRAAGHGGQRLALCIATSSGVNGLQLGDLQAWQQVGTALTGTHQTGRVGGQPGIVGQFNPHHQFAQTLCAHAGVARLAGRQAVELEHGAGQWLALHAGRVVLPVAGNELVADIGLGAAHAPGAVKPGRIVHEANQRRIHIAVGIFAKQKVHVPVAVGHEEADRSAGAVGMGGLQAAELQPRAHGAAGVEHAVFGAVGKQHRKRPVGLEVGPRHVHARSLAVGQALAGDDVVQLPEHLHTGRPHQGGQFAVGGIGQVGMHPFAAIEQRHAVAGGGAAFGVGHMGKVGGLFGLRPGQAGGQAVNELVDGRRLTRGHGVDGQVGRQPVAVERGQLARELVGHRGHHPRMDGVDDGGPDPALAWALLQPAAQGGHGEGTCAHTVRKHPDGLARSAVHMGHGSGNVELGQVVHAVLLFGVPQPVGQAVVQQPHGVALGQEGGGHVAPAGGVGAEHGGPVGQAVDHQQVAGRVAALRRGVAGELQRQYLGRGTGHLCRRRIPGHGQPGHLGLAGRPREGGVQRAVLGGGTGLQAVVVLPAQAPEMGLEQGTQPQAAETGQPDDGRRGIGRTGHLQALAAHHVDQIHIQRQHSRGLAVAGGQAQVDADQRIPRVFLERGIGQALVPGGLHRRCASGGGLEFECVIQGAVLGVVARCTPQALYFLHQVFLAFG